MTPSARIGAAIEILNTYLEGVPVEKALTNWARRSRFAGSKDRAAVRDIVFQCVRCRKSFAFHCSAETGRGLAIAYAALCIEDGAALFDGAGYGPEHLTDFEETTFLKNTLSDDLHVKCDFPEWLEGSLFRALGDELEPVMSKMQSRAGLHLRVNLSKTTRNAVILMLADEQVEAIEHPLSKAGLEVLTNPRKVNNSIALRDGFIELQDAASQAVCQELPIDKGARILDMCAGGGGKSLAMADNPHREIFAHDIDPKRMADLPDRADRMGVKITTLKSEELQRHGPFDLVLCDAPCSGSGAWSRSPDGKWAFTLEKLDKLLITQGEILRSAAKFVDPEGTLAFATCSLLCEENEDQVVKFLDENPEWTKAKERRFSPLEGGDGFYLCCLTRKK